MWGIKGIQESLICKTKNLLGLISFILRQMASFWWGLKKIKLLNHLVQMELASSLVELSVYLIRQSNRQFIQSDPSSTHYWLNYLNQTGIVITEGRTEPVPWPASGQTHQSGPIFKTMILTDIYFFNLNLYLLSLILNNKFIC